MDHYYEVMIRRYQLALTFFVVVTITGLLLGGIACVAQQHNNPVTPPPEACVCPASLDKEEKGSNSYMSFIGCVLAGIAVFFIMMNQLACSADETKQRVETVHKTILNVAELQTKMQASIERLHTDEKKNDTTSFKIGQQEVNDAGNDYDYIIMPAPNYTTTQMTTLRYIECPLTNTNNTKSEDENKENNNNGKDKKRC